MYLHVVSNLHMSFGVSICVTNHSGEASIYFTKRTSDDRNDHKP